MRNHDTTTVFVVYEGWYVEGDLDQGHSEKAMVGIFSDVEKALWTAREAAQSYMTGLRASMDRDDVVSWEESDGRITAEKLGRYGGCESSSYWIEEVSVL